MVKRRNAPSRLAVSPGRDSYASASDLATGEGFGGRHGVEQRHGADAEEDDGARWNGACNGADDRGGEDRQQLPRLRRDAIRPRRRQHEGGGAEDGEPSQSAVAPGMTLFRAEIGASRARAVAL